MLSLIICSFCLRWVVAGGPVTGLPHVPEVVAGLVAASWGGGGVKKPLINHCLNPVNTQTLIGLCVWKWRWIYGCTIIHSYLFKTQKQKCFTCTDDTHLAVSCMVQVRTYTWMNKTQNLFVFLSLHYLLMHFLTKASYPAAHISFNGLGIYF